MQTGDLPRTFGPYTLLRRLAAGGMAEVYLALARGPAGFEKQVALKRVHPLHVADDRTAARLRDEAKLSASLSHRNIVQTFDLTQVGDAYAIVMEHVEGHDAGSVLELLRRRGGSLPVEVAAYVGAEVLRGLDYAHRHRDSSGAPSGIVHRDVSPQNILLSVEGEVKLGDFGIAKARCRLSEPVPGVIKGKYLYMSPEQAWAEPLDHRSDIFSAGLVLWELLVGERVYASRPLPELVEAVREAEIPAPSSRRPDVPKALDAVVAKATARCRDERFESAGAAADLLEAYVATQPGLSPSRSLAEILRELPSQEDADRAYIPCTRDRVSTESMTELDDGEPTLAGWRAPRAPRSRYRWLWTLSASSLAAVAAAWLLHG